MSKPSTASLARCSGALGKSLGKSSSSKHRRRATDRNATGSDAAWIPVDREATIQRYKQKEILVIDGDSDSCRTLTDQLAISGYRVTVVSSVQTARRLQVADWWLAIILDLSLPDQDGFEALLNIRSQCDAPILVYTLCEDESEIVAALEAGADGYLSKRCSVHHLLARLNAVVRRAKIRSSQADNNELVGGNLRIIPNTHQVFIEDRVVPLTPGEFEVLRSLLRVKGRIKTRGDLLTENQDGIYKRDSRAVDELVSSLRRKIGDNPRSPKFIRTLRGLGYMFIEQNISSKGSLVTQAGLYRSELRPSFVDTSSQNEFSYTRIRTEARKAELMRSKPVASLNIQLIVASWVWLNLLLAGARASERIEFDAQTQATCAIKVTNAFLHTSCKAQGTAAPLGSAGDRRPFCLDRACTSKPQEPTDSTSK